MFEYCMRGYRSIVSTLGQFVSYQVKWADENGELLKCEVINSWDRISIAERYLEEYFHYPKDDDTYRCIGGINNKNKFINEVALKIDEFIPKRYFVKYHQVYNTYGSIDGTVLQEKFIDKDSHEITKELKYHFEHDITECRERIGYSIIATNKQIRYIESLCKESGYILKDKENLQSATANEIIQFLIGKIDEISIESYAFLEYE